jgi:hypothetical protein
VLWQWIPVVREAAVGYFADDTSTSTAHMPLFSSHMPWKLLYIEAAFTKSPIYSLPVCCPKCHGIEASEYICVYRRC